MVKQEIILWNAINDYAAVIGGNIGGPSTNRRMDAVAAIGTALRSLLARYEEALTQISALEPIPFEWPEDWHDQIQACEECRSYENHPIQKGICDTHRRPIWNHDSHQKREREAIGWRAKDIAAKALREQDYYQAPGDAVMDDSPATVDDGNPIYDSRDTSY